MMFTLLLVLVMAVFPEPALCLAPIEYHALTQYQCGKNPDTIQQMKKTLQQIVSEISSSQNENSCSYKDSLFASNTQLKETCYNTGKYISPLLSAVEKSDRCINPGMVVPDSLSLDLQEVAACIGSSCKLIALKNSSSPSGYYKISTGNGSNVEIYCDMSGENCDGAGGWTRVAYINMTETGSQCPQGLHTQTISGAKYCGKFPDFGGCTSTTFLVHNTRYTQICGQVRGFQYGSPDASYNHLVYGQSVEGLYCDGISITVGHPRQHIWTYIAGVSSNIDAAYLSSCPCNTYESYSSPPSGVGDDYYCESGNAGPHWSLVLYSDDPLWDGEQCEGFEDACCNNPKMPWFIKTLDQPITKDIELRACSDEGNNNEAIPMLVIELYVR